MTGSSGGTTVTRTDPPGYVQPYAVQHLQRASGLSQNPYQLYTGNFMLPRSPLGPMPTPEQFTTQSPNAFNPAYFNTPGASSGSVFNQAGYDQALANWRASGQPQSVSPDAFLNSRIAGFSPEQEEGLNAIAQRARAGSPVMGAASENLLGTLRGDFLNNNPYVDSIADITRRNVMTQMGPAFARSGSTGNTGLAQVTAQQLSDAENKLRFDAYNQERTRQMQANLFAPQAAAADYADAQALLGVGDVRQGMDQLRKDTAYEEFLRQQGYPYDQVNVLGDAVQRATGGITTQQGPNSYNRAAGALGGALGGAGLYSMMGGPMGAAMLTNPWGWAALAGGALLGGGVLG